jgi:hypothetical protein
MATKFAPALYPMSVQAEAAVPQLSEQDLEKLQEIHELLNLLMREITALTPITAGLRSRSAVPAVPYTYSFLQFP